MGIEADKLLGLMPGRKGHDLSYEEVKNRQIAAMNERLQEQIGRIKLVALRAADAGIAQIGSLQDAVQLLLPHTAFKSYPESVLLDRNWAKLTKWLNTLSAYPTDNTDLAGIGGIDEWIDRLQLAGHYVSCSSGTTGKPAMLIVSEKDIKFNQQEVVNAVCWATGLEPNQDRLMFGMAPVAKVPKNTAVGMGIFQAFARTDQVPYAYPAPPITVSSITDMTVMRRKIADGTALPDEIAAYEAISATRAQAMAEAISVTADALIAARAEKLFLLGMWSGHYAVAKAVRERGYGAKDFHPDNAIFTSGGLKRALLPDDYRAFVYETFNLKAQRSFLAYGMQEVQTLMPRCRHGRYHVPAWLVVLPLNEEGDKILPIGEGAVTGRAAFFDLSMDGRWGGIISGDRIELQVSPCGCGAKSPSIADNIVRYADLAGDDKIGCAGTVDAYVTGLA